MCAVRADAFSAFQTTSKLKPHWDYQIQTRYIGTLNPHPRPRQWRQGSGNRLLIRLEGNLVQAASHQPKHHLIRLQRKRLTHRPTPMESVEQGRDHPKRIARHRLARFIVKTRSSLTSNAIMGSFL